MTRDEAVEELRVIHFDGYDDYPYATIVACENMAAIITHIDPDVWARAVAESEAAGTLAHEVTRGVRT